MKAKPTQSHIDDKYAMRRYVAEHWLDHTAAFSNDTEHYLKLVQLATEKHLPFDFRPWGDNSHFGPFGCIACPHPSSDDPPGRHLLLTSMFHWAASSGHEALIGLITDDYLNHERYHHETCRIACRKGHAKILRMLFERSTWMDENAEQDLFELACASGQASCVEDFPSEQPFTVTHKLFHSIIASNQVQTVDLTYSRSRDAYLSPNAEGDLPIHVAAAKGFIDLIEILLRSNRDQQLNMVSASGLTPFEVAAQYDQITACEVLLRLGSGPNREDKDEESPLIKAVLRGSTALVELLLKAGADPARLVTKKGPLNVPGHGHLFGLTAIEVAVQHRNLEMIKMLSTALMPHKPLFVRLALCRAVRDCNEEAIRTLIEHNGLNMVAKAVVGQMDDAGMTKKILELLPDVKPPAINGWLSNQPLFRFAINMDDLDFVKLLARKGISIHVTDSSGNTPLHVAIQQKREAIIKFLIDFDDLHYPHTARWGDDPPDITGLKTENIQNLKRYLSNPRATSPLVIAVGHDHLPSVKLLIHSPRTKVDEFREALLRAGRSMFDDMIFLASKTRPEWFADQEVKNIMKTHLE